MSGFVAKCLVNIADADADFEAIMADICKGSREEAVEATTKMVIEHVTCWDDPNSAGLPGYCASDGWFGDEESAVFGCEEPIGLIKFARNMRVNAVKQARNLFRAAGYETDATIQDILTAETDTYRTYEVHHATGILDGRVNSDCDAMVYTSDGIWKPWPDLDELDKIEADPSKWAVLELLFKD